MSDGSTDMKKTEETPVEEVVELNLSRQSKLVPIDTINNYTLKVFGVGSVGSHFAKVAAKTGFRNIEVYDMDTVKEENIAAQAFDFEHIGQNKVDAMVDVIKRATGTEIIAHHGKVSEENPIIPEANNIYCCFFDSFEGRQMVFDMLKGFPVIFVDGRIGQYNMRHYLVELDDAVQVEAYNSSLNTGAVSELQCGEKACAPINVQIAGKLVMNILNYVSGKDYNKVYIGNAAAPATDMNILKIREKEAEKKEEVSQSGGSSQEV